MSNTRKRSHRGAKQHATIGSYSFVGQMPPRSTSFFTPELTQVKFYARCALFHTVDRTVFQVDENILQNLLSRQADHTFILHIDGLKGWRLFRSIFDRDGISILTDFFKQCYKLTLTGTFDIKPLEELNAVFKKHNCLTHLSIRNFKLYRTCEERCNCMQRFLSDIPKSIVHLNIDFTLTPYAGFQKPLRWIFESKIQFNRLKVCVRAGFDKKDLKPYTNELAKCLSKDGVGIILISNTQTTFINNMKDEVRDGNTRWSIQDPVVHSSLYDDQSLAWFSVFLREFDNVQGIQQGVRVYILPRIVDKENVFKREMRNYDFYSDCWNFNELANLRR